MKLALPTLGKLNPLLLTLLLGGTVVSFSNSALNPAIPVFMTVFSVSIKAGSWVLNAYVLAMSVGLMLSGYLSQKYSSQKLFMTSIGLFTVGSCLGVIAPSMTVVIAARAIQGLAGGIIIPLSIGLLYRMYPIYQHGRIMAVWGVVIMLSLAIGPLVGAVLVARWAWWSLFAVTIPLGLLAVMMARYFLPADDSEALAPSFDLVGFLGLLGGIASLMFGLDYFTNAAILGSVSWLRLVVFVVFLGLLAAAWWRYERQHLSPLIPVTLLNNKVYLFSTIISVSQTVGLMLCLLLLPVIIQDIMQREAIWTGWVLMAATLIASIATHFAGRVVDDHGARYIGVIGVLISALATLLLALVVPQASLGMIMVLMCLRGAGVGLAYLPTTTVGFSSLPKHQVTQGAALNNITRRICSAVLLAQVGVYIALREQQMVSGDHALAQMRRAAQALAIQEVFFITALLLLLTLPFAAKLPAQRSGSRV